MSNDRDDRDHHDQSSPDQARQEQDQPRRSSGPEPEFLAYTVRDRGRGRDAIWNRIGAAWPHRDGKGYDVALEANPLDGRISLREQRREEFAEERRRSAEERRRSAEERRRSAEDNPHREDRSTGRDR